MSIYNQTKSDGGRIVSVSILSKDRYGLVNDIMSELARQNVDIRHHRARVFTDCKNAEMSSVELKISLDGGQNLQTVLHRLHKIRGVVSVSAC